MTRSLIWGSVGWKVVCILSKEDSKKIGRGEKVGRVLEDVFRGGEEDSRSWRSQVASLVKVDVKPRQ
jgi:hypothetical protein